MWTNVTVQQAEVAYVAEIVDIDGPGMKEKELFLNNQLKL